MSHEAVSTQSDEEIMAEMRAAEPGGSRYQHLLGIFQARKEERIAQMRQREEEVRRLKENK